MLKPVSIIADGKEVTTIGAQKVVRIPTEIVRRAIKDGSFFDVVYKGKSLVKMGVRFSGFRALHLGMVTSRYEQGRGEMNVVSGYTTTSMPWIKIHNKLDVPITFNNGSIYLKANEWIRYTGKHHIGVAMGTFFVNDQGLFPEFIISKPITDLYFGYNSDIKQALYGGFMMGEISDSDREPTYLENDGWFS